MGAAQRAEHRQRRSRSMASSRPSARVLEPHRARVFQKDPLHQRRRHFQTQGCQDSRHDRAPHDATLARHRKLVWHWNNYFFRFPMQHASGRKKRGRKEIPFAGERFRSSLPEDVPGQLRGEAHELLLEPGGPERGLEHVEDLHRLVPSVSIIVLRFRLRTRAFAR